MTDLSETRQIPQSLAITLTMTDEVHSSIRQGETYLEVARAYEIVDADTAQLAANELRNVNKAVDKLEELRKGFVAPARQIIDNARALFNPAIEGYQQSATLLRSRLTEWQGKEQKRIALENAQREEAARKARQEAEAKAAAERARAEEIAAQKRKEAEEAEIRRQQAEAEGNARAAQAAAAQAAKAQEQAAAAIESGAAKAQQTQLQAAAQATTAAPAAQAKIAGFSTRENYVPVLQPGVTEEAAKALMVKAAADGRTDLLALLKTDESALKKLAKALKGAMNVPGYVAQDQPIGAGARK